MSLKQRLSSNFRPFVIGTSGHIDHGKTSLVKAITGVDTDRLEEEKKRGITIDLGFANYEDDNGRQMAFVDVPGHEKFIHNMLAGIAGIDAVLLVVAADKGIMPQTREHLNICNLLKIGSGLVALTKVDLVDDTEMLKLCHDEILELLEGTFLEGQPVIPVSSTHGDGIDEVKGELAKLYNKINIQDVEKSFRLNVDRSFTLKGFGTVVTGTVLCGSINQDNEVEQFPQKRAIRIRGLQTQGKKVNEVFVGQRAALNLGGISKEEIKRGDQLAKKNSLLTSYMINATFFLLDEVSTPLKNRTRIRLFIGSKEVIGRIFFLEGSYLSPGKRSMVQLRLESLVSSKYGDNFIIRSFTPMHTLGGGMVIDPSPSKSRRMQREFPKRLVRMYKGDENVRAEEVIFLQSVRGVKESEFSVRSGLSLNQSRKAFKFLQSKQKVVCLDKLSKRYLHVEHLGRIANYLKRILEFHHKKFSDRKGMTRSELAGKLNLIFNEREVEVILKYIVNLGGLTQNSNYYHLLEHQQQFSKSQDDLLKRCLRLISSGGFQPIRRTRLLEEVGLNKKDGLDILKSAVHSKQLLSVAEDLYYTPNQIEEILLYLREYLYKNRNITVIQFKELLKISRKHAIDLLEYFDKQHLTIRQDNFRIPGTILANRN